MKRRRNRFNAMLAFVLALTIFLLPVQTLAWENPEIEPSAPEMQTETVEIEEPSVQEELPDQTEPTASEEPEAETEAETEAVAETETVAETEAGTEAGTEPNRRGTERSVTHDHSGVAFTPWDSATSLPPAAGNYYLTADVTISSRWDAPAGITNLCLNGHGIIRTNASDTTGSVIQVGSGATLNLYDCDTTTVHRYSIENPSANGAGLGVLNDGGAYSFTGGYITGGVISGAADGNHLIGGGVNVVSGSFTMNGGTIFGNKVCINGGGVKVKGAGASFTMNGGAILANYNDCYGGAISVGDNGSNRLCTLTINGGTIARNWSGRNGGAIHLDSYNHTFILTGGRIVNNYTNGNYDNGSIGRAGGGILKDGTSLKLSGNPVIKDNFNGGNQPNDLYLRSDKSDILTLSGLTSGADVCVTFRSLNASSDIKVATGAQKADLPYIRYSSAEEGAIVYCDGEKDWVYDNGAYVALVGAHHTHEAGTVWAGVNPAACVTNNGTTTAYAAFADALNAWTVGSTLKLLADVSVSSTVTVPSGAHSLDLNGYALKAASAGYCVVTVGSGASLTIDDSSDSIGKITGGSVGQNYGGGVTVDGGTLTLRGGAITGNANTNGGIGNCGGGVHVRNSGKFYMEGGEISGNTSYVGGGVCTDTSATTVSITGGVIKNNRTDRFGSAAWAGRNSAAIFRIGGSAQIIDNISTWTGDKDGEGTLNTGNTYLLSGDPTVHGDWKTNGTSSPNTHINLDNDGSSIQRIELEGALTNSTGTPKLTVTPLYRWNDLANGQTFLFTNNWSVYMGAAHPADYFKVDDGVTGVRVIRKDGEAALTGSGELGDLYITFEANGGEGAMEPQLTTTPSAALNQNTYTREGFDFIGWNTAADGSGTDYDDAAAVTLTGDLTLYAQWGEEVNLLEGAGTEEQPYLIRSADDWDALSAYINGGGTKYRGKYFLLTQNISVTTALGNRPNTGTDSEDNVFSGVFDGGGYTLNVNIDDPVFAAPFAVAHNATIRNLHVTGSTHSSANHASGLVAASKGRSIYDASSLTIQNVTVSVDVSCNSHVAGIVGHAHSANITMENVVFDGSISASSVQGGMIGWGGLGNGAKFSASFKDCLFIGTYNKSAAFYPVAFANGQGTTTLINDFYTTSLGSGGSPITPTGDGQVKLLAATVEKDGKVSYFDSIAPAAGSENWTAGSTLKLMADVTTSSTVSVPSGEHILDLNGYGIRMTGSGSVLNVGSSTKLIINDSNPEAEHKFTVSNTRPNGAGLATVNDGLTSDCQTFTGGYITGGSAQKGGGILVQSGGSLTLNGGAIIGNQSSFMGGGIKIDGDSAYHEDRFIMNGGTVMYNTVSGWGAGICSDDSVKMTGGTVAYNYATNNPGGIHCHYLYLSGGRVEYNYAGATDYAAGAHADHEIFISGSPVVANNVVNGAASNLDWDRTEYRHGHKLNLTGALTEEAKLSVTMRVDGSGEFTNGWETYMGSADPSKYFTSDNDSYQVFLNDNGEAEIGTPPVASVISGDTATDYRSFFDAVNAWTAGSTLKLLTDVTTSSTVNVPSGEHTLDLNGHGIKMTGSGSVIRVSEQSTLNLKDSDPSTEHKYTISNPAANGAGVATVNDALTVGYQTFMGGYITGGYMGGGYTYGAGINIEGNGATLNMYGGTIIGNRLTAGSTGGGGVCVQDWDKSGGFNMYGGTIIGNTANYGGGVYVRSGTMILYNGEISNNVANNNIGGAVLAYGGASTFVMEDGILNGNLAQHGGALEASGGGTITISGGSLTNNLATGKGGALTNQRSDGDTSPAVFNISGAPVFSGNTAGGQSSDVYLCNTAVLNVTGEMSNAAPIGVSRASGAGTFTSGWKTYMGSADPAKYFTSDNADYEVRPENGEAILSYPYVSGVSAEGFSGDYDGKAHSITVTVPNGATVKYGTTEGDYSLTECPAYTDAGTYTVYYQATQDKHLPVAGSATVQIDPINATVTVTGKAALTDYDGEVHTVSGYDAVASTPLYDVTKDFTFSGKAEAVRANAGTAYMGLAPEQFANTNRNFAEVTFDVTDGYVTVRPINVTVTITGHNAIVDYDGQAHSVSGYDVQIGNALYKESYFSFSGDATATRTEKGKTEMGLSAEQFTNINTNFGTVTFDVTDGYIMVAPIDVTVTIVGNHDTVDYDGTEHSVSDYTATADTDLYDVNSDFVFTGSAAASQTDAGTAKMGLSAEQFTNTNENFAVVVFMVTDGYVTVNPIDAAVTVTGHSAVADYDGEAHSVSGYDASASTPLYDVTKDVAFIGSASATQINAGTADMGLSAEQFSNTNANFATVTFRVTDGYMTVNPIDVAVTITGHTATADYDGKEHTVTGYDVSFGSALYGASDFTFSGKAEATRVDAGTTKMGLAPEQFANTNPNFATATFRVTDGQIKINTVDAVITAAPVSTGPIYDGAWKELVLPGTAEGGTMYYALGDDPRNAPAADSFDTVIPSAKEIGSYYVWYKVEADSNHNDLSPAYVKVTLADASWLTLTGTLYRSDGVTPLADAVVTLMNGDQAVDYVITDGSGNYQFIVPAGVYSVLIENGTSSSTTIAEIFEDSVLNISVSEGKTESLVMLNGDGSTDFGIAVGGLAEEAAAIRANSGIGADDEVSLVMTVELKTNNTAKNGADFSYLLQTKSFMFFDITLTQTIGIETTVMDATTNVLEIAVPYEKTGRQDLMVYSSDGTGVRYFLQSDSKEAGTFRIDKANGYIFIYADRFATFAIGYTPHYRLNSTMTLGSFEGNVNVVITSNLDGTEYTLENIAPDQIRFADIPKGSYTMTVTWEDGATNTLTVPLTVS